MLACHALAGEQRIFNAVLQREAILKFLVIQSIGAALVLFYPGVVAASCLDETAVFSERVCGEILTKGSSQMISGSGQLSAEAKGLIAKMIGSAEGTGKFDSVVSSYENVVREELGKELASTRECKMKMVDIAVKQVCKN
jgi:hypothetical protein